MQPSRKSINHERNLSVFLFGHDYDEPTNVKQFHKYSQEPGDSDDDDSDDENHFIPPGKTCLFYVFIYALQ